MDVLVSPVMDAVGNIVEQQHLSMCSVYYTGHRTVSNNLRTFHVGARTDSETDSVCCVVSVEQMKIEDTADV